MEEEQKQGRAVGSLRAWDAAVAVAFLAFGALVMWDSRRLGVEWASDGPQAGYFPYFIGLLICVSSVVNLVSAFGQGESGRRAFVEWHQLKMILIVMVPCVIYVALIVNPWYSLGIYEASAVFIAFFMAYLGKYKWPKIAAVAIGTMTVFFLMFEVWFKVPLPKGPIEALLGFR